MREVGLVLDGEAERRNRDLDLAYYTAWHAGVFSQQYPKGKFPPFDKHSPRRGRRASKPQTAAQMQAIARQITAALGGKIVRK